MAGAMVRVWWRALGSCLLVAAGMALGPANAAEPMVPLHTAAPEVDDQGNARVIVKYRTGSSLAQSRQGAQHLGRQLRLALSDGHALGGRSQSLRARGIGAQDLADRLAAQADVEWAVPVQRKTVRGVVPNDPLFAAGQTSATPAVGQWYLRAPDATLVSAVNALGAWAVTEGSASVTVAVLDTGVRYDHPDLAGKLWPGYDFVSRTASSNDGGGADSDANDPGDWGGGCSTSSWHGTQVAGLVGAATNNGIGIAGTGGNTMVLPVRVLGRCGGWDDDILAGMRWAGGLGNAAGCTASSAVTATCNPHPARVLNLSLGASGACNQGYRDVIAELNAAGVVVVVAAGNDSGHAVITPANCAGALAVAGVRHTGTKVAYSNLGPQVAIAAPGGNCANATGTCLYALVTTLNAGATTPGASSYSSGSEPTLGTSFSAPIVAGAIGLMLAVDPSLTPATVKTVLQATARAFPSTGAQEPGTLACRAPSGADQLECYCTTSTCGAGLLDAAAAVAAVDAAKSAPTVVLAASSTVPDAGTAVTLDGSGSRAISGRSIAAYQWAIVGGSGLASLIGATNGSSVSLGTKAAGTVTVRLTVTDSAGASRSSTVAINVADATRAVIAVSTAVPTVGQVVTLSGTGSRAASGRSVVGHQWAVVSGAASASITGATDKSTARLTTVAAGTVVVQLTVTDSAGARRSASQAITVAPALAAAIDASTTTPTAGTAVSLGGTRSTAANGRPIVRHQWAITSGSARARFTGASNGSSAILGTSAAGTVVVQLTVTDSSGASRSATLAIQVVAPPVAVIAATNTHPTAGTALTLGGAGSSAGSGRAVVSHQWSIVGGSGLARFGGATNGSTALLRTSAAGTVVVQLTVTDSAGARHSSTLTVDVVAPPVAVIAASTTKPVAGAVVSLSGTGSSAGSGRTVAGHQWSITSGMGLASFSGATNAGNARLATMAAGTVVVRLTVTDSAGASRSATKSVTVR